MNISYITSGNISAYIFKYIGYLRNYICIIKLIYNKL